METKPRYLEIVESLEKDLQTLPPNSLMPTENQLAKRFDVSRVTVRQALGFLQRAGKVSRQRGQGTIISPPKITRNIVPTKTIEQDVLDQGLDLETRLLAYERNASPPDHIRKALDLDAGQSAGYLTLLRLVQGRVISLDQRFLPPQFADDFNPSLIGTRPFRQILDEWTRAPVVRSTCELEIVPSIPDIAKALRLTPGVLILQNSFVGYSSPGTPVEAGTVSYRIDRVRIGLVLANRAHQPQEPLAGPATR